MANFLDVLGDIGYGSMAASDAAAKTWGNLNNLQRDNIATNNLQNQYDADFSAGVPAAAAQANLAKQQWAEREALNKSIADNVRANRLQQSYDADVNNNIFNTASALAASGQQLTTAQNSDKLDAFNPQTRQAIGALAAEHGADTPEFHQALAKYYSDRGMLDQAKPAVTQARQEEAAQNVVSGALRKVSGYEDTRYLQRGDDGNLYALIGDPELDAEGNEQYDAVMVPKGVAQQYYALAYGDPRALNYDKIMQEQRVKQMAAERGVFNNTGGSQARTASTGVTGSTKQAATKGVTGSTKQAATKEQTPQQLSSMYLSALRQAHTLNPGATQEQIIAAADALFAKVRQQAPATSVTPQAAAQVSQPTVSPLDVAIQAASGADQLPEYTNTFADQVPDFLNPTQAVAPQQSYVGNRLNTRRRNTNVQTNRGGQ